MIKCKIFEGDDLDEIESEVNDFLSSNKVKFAGSNLTTNRDYEYEDGDRYDTWHYALVIFYKKGLI